MKRRDKVLELNQAFTTSSEFMDSYNRSLPHGYPQASVKNLKQFQLKFPILFKNTEEWSIEKHRKKMMDWLSSHHDTP